MSRRETLEPRAALQCASCRGVLLGPTQTCPWCYRELSHGSAQVRPEVRVKLERITGRLRVVVERDGWACWLCERPVDPFDLGGHRASVDHVVPKSEGGGDRPANLMLAHASCNEYRAGSRVEPFWSFDRSEFADFMRRRKVLGHDYY